MKDDKIASINKSWFLTITGILVSIICFSTIQGLLLLTAYVAKNVQNSESVIFPTKKSLLLSLIPLFIWILFGLSEQKEINPHDDSTSALDAPIDEE